MRDARLVVQRLLNELKWRSKAKYPFNSSRRGNLYVIADNFGNIASGRQVSKAFRHPSERVIRMKKFARYWIDQSDPARHVRQHFLVEDHFTFESLLRFQLPLIKPAAQPREYGRQANQPGRQNRHSPEKVVNRFVSHGDRLLHKRHPPSGFDTTEGIEVILIFEVPTPALPNLIQ